MASGCSIFSRVNGSIQAFRKVNTKKQPDDPHMSEAESPGCFILFRVDRVGAILEKLLEKDIVSQFYF